MKAASHGYIDKLVAMSHQGIDVTTAQNKVIITTYVT